MIPQKFCPMKDTVHCALGLVLQEQHLDFGTMATCLEQRLGFGWTMAMY